MDKDPLLPVGMRCVRRSFRNVHHKVSPRRLFEEKKIKTVSDDISISLSFLALRPVDRSALPERQQFRQGPPLTRHLLFA
jgi:hypothetical protein